MIWSPVFLVLAKGNGRKAEKIQQDRVVRKSSLRLNLEVQQRETVPQRKLERSKREEESQNKTS